MQLWINSILNAKHEGILVDLLVLILYLILGFCFVFLSQVQKIK